MEAALRIRDQGKARFLGVSCHRRPTFRKYIDDGLFDVVMFRYNAAHRGAETEVLPHMCGPNRPGTVAYTATRWGHLLDSKRMPPGETAPRASDCYRFVLSQPNIDLCLSGPANVDQMKDGLYALDRGPLSEEEMTWMRRVGDTVNRRYF